MTEPRAELNFWTAELNHEVSNLFETIDIHDLLKKVDPDLWPIQTLAAMLTASLHLSYWLDYFDPDCELGDLATRRIQLPEPYHVKLKADPDDLADLIDRFRKSHGQK